MEGENPLRKISSSMKKRVASLAKSGMPSTLRSLSPAQWKGLARHERVFLPGRQRPRATQSARYGEFGSIPRAARRLLVGLRNAKLEALLALV